MDLQSYRYTGPVSAMILPDGREQRLTPDSVLALDPKDFFTQRLVSLGHLHPMEVLPVASPHSEPSGTQETQASAELKSPTKKKGAR